MGERAERPRVFLACAGPALHAQPGAIEPSDPILLAYPTVPNHDGSWTEWGNLVNAPIEK